MKSLLKLYVQNRKILYLTFEIFWTLVFLLQSAISSAGSEIAPFVYVNF